MATDRLAQEMARFEQEVLGVATSAPRPPPKFTVNPTPLITKPIYNSQPLSSMGIQPPPPVPLIPSETISTTSSIKIYTDSTTKSAVERAAEAVAIHTGLKNNRLRKRTKDVKKLRCGGGQVWEDPTLEEWDRSDYRIFCGDLGNDVNDDTLAKSFSRYPSFQKAKVIRDKWTKKTKGYGFVSFKDPHDYMQAMKEMNGKYVGSRPIRLKKSTWKDRSFVEVKKKAKEKKKLGLKY